MGSVTQAPFTALLSCLSVRLKSIGMVAASVKAHFSMWAFLYEFMLSD